MEGKEGPVWNSTPRRHGAARCATTVLAQESTVGSQLSQLPAELAVSQLSSVFAASPPASNSCSRSPHRAAFSGGKTTEAVTFCNEVPQRLQYYGDEDSGLCKLSRFSDSLIQNNVMQGRPAYVRMSIECHTACNSATSGLEVGRMLHDVAYISSQSCMVFLESSRIVPSPTHTTTCSVGSAGLHKNQLTTNQVGTTSPRAGTGQSSVRAYDAQAMTVLSTCIPRFGRASFYVKCLNWHCCLCACCCNLSRCPVLLCPSAMTKAWLRRLAIRGYEETRCGRSSRKSRSREAGTRKKEATSRPW